MKKMERFLATVLSVIVLIGMMPSVAYAKSVNEVVVSIPSRNISTSYKAYNELWRAEKNKIILHVKQEEFPIYATLYGDNGGELEYEFDSYGIKQLEGNNPGGGTVMLSVFTFPIGGPLWIPEPKVYATIEIVPPQQEERTPIQREERTDEKLEDPEEKFEPLIHKINRISNYSTYIHEWHINEYVSGKWDGTTADYSYNGMSYGSIDNRTYRWRGVDPYTGKNYNDIDVNIDYIGPLDVITNRYFTLAVNYNTGEIEQWVLLEKKDSWKIQLDAGEKIDRLNASYEIHDDKIQGMVFTSDLEGKMHIYWLLPNKKVEKIC